MYPWIASPAMAKVVAFETMRAEHQAARRPAKPARAAQDAAEDAVSVTDTWTTRRPRWVVHALRLAH